MGAGGMGDHQVPSIGQYLLDWLLQVPLRIALTVQQIAAPCIVTATAECVTDPSAVFTSDEDPHMPYRLANLAW